MAICTLPFSGILYQKLGYISKITVNCPNLEIINLINVSELIIVSLMFEFSGIVYTILVLEESQVVNQNNHQVDEKTDRCGPSLELNESNTIKDEFNENLDKESDRSLIKNKVFDAIRNVVFVVMRPRNGNGRMIVWLLLFCNFVYIGCEYGKS